ncbi:unnamed protein product [Rotaria magnacalcarata]|uniref:MACPF domain-containing protein n=2 Tax=Rotaria magnacalcarata TaxID=392030 RepID=A0A819VLT8_9BILA|nr:unnamed protein product [Rotaria magnacalcarata]CAF4110648.1 unnamed protein product [Rotaria magnacalcarata]
MALAVQLTYPPEGTRAWTDGHTGGMFDIFNEAIIGPANRVVAAYDTARVHIFRNASQLNTAWRQTFADNKVRGGELARPPDLMEYFDNYFAHGHALALSQRVIGLYTLTINASTIQLNPFARHALSQLTTAFDPDLYEAFVEAWGTHIITRSLVGGMIEERAKVARCLNAGDDGVVAQCIPSSDRIPISSNCAYYADRARMISKRHLGGNIQVENDNDWRRTLAVGPALLQILEMVPWYDFVTDNSVKQNLRAIIRYRERNIDLVQTEAVRQVNARLSPCISDLTCTPFWTMPWLHQGTILTYTNANTRIFGDNSRSICALVRAGPVNADNIVVSIGSSLSGDCNRNFAIAIADGRHVHLYGMCGAYDNYNVPINLITLYDGAFHQICVTYNNENARLCVYADLQSPYCFIRGNARYNTATGDVRIGWWVNTDRQFSARDGGMIKSVSLYDRSISQHCIRHQFEINM